MFCRRIHNEQDLSLVKIRHKYKGRPNKVGWPFFSFIILILFFNNLVLCNSGVKKRIHPQKPYNYKTDYIADYEDLTRIGKRIVRAWEREGFVCIMIEGPRGIGKSTTSLKIATEVIKYRYEVNTDDALDILINDNHVMFTIDELIESTNNMGNLEDIENMDTKQLRKLGKQRSIVQVWDDAGMHGGKHKYRDADAAEIIGSLIDTYRDIASCLIITTPNISRLLKDLRDYKDVLLVEIHHYAEGGGPYSRRAIFKEYWKSRRGWDTRPKWEIPHYSICLKPDFWYYEYKKLKSIARTKQIEEYRRKRRLEAEEMELKELRLKKQREKLTGGKKDEEETTTMERTPAEAERQDYSEIPSLA